MKKIKISKKAKLFAKYFVNITLIASLLASCSPAGVTSDNADDNTATAIVTQEIVNTPSPTPEPTATVEPTPEPTPTPITNIEGVTYDEVAGTVTIDLFGGIVFEDKDMSNFTFVDENTFSFDSEVYGGTVFSNSLYTYVQDSEEDVPIAGFMIKELPKFFTKEAMLAYFVANGDLVAKMILDDKLLEPSFIVGDDELKAYAETLGIDFEEFKEKYNLDQPEYVELQVPFNNNGEETYSDKLKIFAESHFSDFKENALKYNEIYILYLAEIFKGNKLGCG